MATEPIPPVTEDDKLWAGLGYVGLVLLIVPTLIIFLLKRDESPYLKFQLLQAMGYGICYHLINIGFAILIAVPVFGFLAAVVLLCVNLGLFGYWIALIVMAFSGKEIRIPILGDFIEQQFMK